MNFDTAILYTNDLQSSVAFFTNLGLRLDVQHGEYYASFTFPNNAKLGIKIADKDWEVPGHQTVILSVENIDECYHRVKSSGAEIFSQVTRYDWGGHFIALDPSGNKIEFVQRPL